MTDNNTDQNVTNIKESSLTPYLREDRLSLILARHGQRGRDEPRIEGYPGHPLTPLGHRQAKLLARRLEPVHLDHIYCSDMARAYQTSQPIHDLKPDVPFDLTTDLRELSVADQPNYPPDINEQQREQLHQKRIANFITRLRKNHKMGEVVLIVAHGGMNRRIIETLSGQKTLGPLQIALHNTSLCVAGIDSDGVVTLRLSNCTRHLPLDMVNGDTPQW